MYDKMFSQTGWYTRFEKWTMVVYLNLLFLISCLPLITIGPAILTLTKLVDKMEEMDTFSNVCIRYVQEFNYFLKKRWLESTLPLFMISLVLFVGFWVMVNLSNYWMTILVLSMICSGLIIFLAVLPCYFQKLAQRKKVGFQIFLAEVVMDVHMSTRLVAWGSMMVILFVTSFIIWPVLSAFWLIIGFYWWARGIQVILEGGIYANIID